MLTAHALSWLAGSLPLLIGESNPYSLDPDDALLPYPDMSAGHRLATVILDMPRNRYLRAFNRCNLVAGQEWSMPEARRRASEILFSYAGPLILLGQKVAEAFGYGGTPPYTSTTHNARPVILLPHPSGRCRSWNERGAMQRARDLVLPLCAGVE